MGHDWKPEQGAYERVFLKLKDLVIRYEKDEGDPEIVPVIREVELPKEARKIYDEMEKELLTFIQGKAIESVNGAVAYGKCRQIANGGLYLEKAKGTKARKWVKVHDEKTEDLKCLVDELNGMPVLIAYEFNHDLERLQEAFPNIPYIGKGVSDKATEILIRDWNAGKLPMLAAHPASASKGLNLQGVESAVAFYGISNNFDWVDQFIKRIARKGQSATHIFVYFFVARNTVDEVVKAGLEAKEFNQDIFNGYFSRYYEDDATKDRNVSKAKIKQGFAMLRSAFEDMGTELPPYAPDMDIIFLQMFEEIFRDWKREDLLTFCEYMDVKVTKPKTIKVDKLIDACLEYVCGVFNAREKNGWKIENLEALKLYPNVKTKAEITTMAFGATKKKSTRERVAPRSKFSPNGEVEQNRKARQEAEEAEETKTSTRKPSKKAKSLFSETSDQDKKKPTKKVSSKDKGSIGAGWDAKVKENHAKYLAKKAEDEKAASNKKGSKKVAAKKEPVKKVAAKKEPVKKVAAKKEPVKKVAAKTTTKKKSGFGSRSRRG